jgi:biotin carboxyl carrier protein
MQSHPFTGEDLFVLERVIISPASGQFRPLDERSDGDNDAGIAAGEPIGFLDLPGGSCPVHSPFGGRLMGMLAHAGERVREGQPLAWLRVA